MKLPRNNKELQEYFEANKDLSEEEMMKVVNNVFEIENKQREDERTNLNLFAEKNSHLSNKERAYKFIEYYYDNYPKTFGDYELLTLIISRGKNYQVYQPDLYETWKINRKQKIEDVAYSFSISDKDELKIDKYNIEDLLNLDVSKNHKLKIPDFWGHKRNTEDTIDATMLRITEWCKISGFEGYWKRLVNDIELSVPYGIEERYCHFLWFYSTCRSDYAIELMNSKLLILLDICVIPHDSEVEHPWNYISFDFKNSETNIYNSAFIAAAIIFVIIRLGKRRQYDELINKAIEFLISAQMTNGAWKPFSRHGNPSIETTALCIHALVLSNPEDYSYVKSKALEWIYSVQDIWGMWFEDGNPHITSEFLTVLVLDSIELVDDNFDLITFNFHNKKKDESEINTKKNHNIEVKDKSKQNKINRYKIFLASSSELEADRREIEIFLSRKNSSWRDKGIYLELVIWENFLDAMSQTRLQDEYNKAIKECDIFLMLFFTKVGKYTQEEFETAFGQFKETDRPKIFTYFKDCSVNMSEINDEVMSLLNFKKKLKGLEHFVTTYKNMGDFKYHFGQQLDKLVEKGYL